jgi:hypothetical protein
VANPQGHPAFSNYANPVHPAVQLSLSRALLHLVLNMAVHQV